MKPCDQIPALVAACALLYPASPAHAATISASGASPVESVTITLPAGLMGNSKLFVRVVATSN